MIAEAIQQAFPEAKNISVDLATIRWSDRAKALRYIYLTPRVAQEAIIKFDQGLLPNGPFSFKLNAVNITSSNIRANNRNPTTSVGPIGPAQLQRGRSSTSVPTRVGGKAPPNLRTRREFGVRALQASPDGYERPDAESQAG
jgi:hypothetical protein